MKVYEESMTELKRMQRSTDYQTLTSAAPKRRKADAGMSSKENKEKIGERIGALQQLVSPFGKTDTASVLLEAVQYISFLQDQVKVLSAPYLLSGPVNNMEEQDMHSLRRRGLCLVPVTNIAGLVQSNGADIWAPIKTSSLGSF